MTPLKNLDRMMEFLALEKFRELEDFTILIVCMTIIFYIWQMIRIFRRGKLYSESFNGPEQSSNLTDDRDAEEIDELWTEDNSENSSEDDDNSLWTDENDRSVSGDQEAVESGLPSPVESKNEIEPSISNQVSDSGKVCVTGCFPNLCPIKGRCVLCRTNLIESTNFSSMANLKTWPIVNTYTCQTKHVIYLVTCLRHQVQYVGSTKEMKKRWSKHKHTIVTCHQHRLNQQKDGKVEKIARVCSLARHFYEADHDDDPIACLQVQIIDHVQEESDPLKTDDSLKERETMWMEVMELLDKNQGLNVQKAGKRSRT